MNVASYYEVPEAGAERTETFQAEEAQRILEQAIADGRGARWAIALMLGVQPSEALGLDWTKLDGDTRTINQQIHKPKCKPTQLLDSTKTRTASGRLSYRC